MFVEQSEEAIAAGAFHNDVVAVANEHVLFAHELAFADRDAGRSPTASGGCPASSWSRCPLRKCRSPTRSLLSVQRAAGDSARRRDDPDRPDRGARNAVGLVWLERHLAGNGPIRRVEVVDVRQSMANGGGPACLRLRVVADPATVDPRFLVDDGEARPARRGRPRGHWPVEIDNADLQKPALIRDVEAARAALLGARSILAELDLIPETGQKPVLTAIVTLFFSAGTAQNCQ